MAHSSRRLSGFLRRLRDDTCGNIIMMTSVGLLTLLLAVGFVVDFSRAETVQTQLNAIADAAALAAVDPAMIYQSDQTSVNAALAMFNSQASQLSGITNVNVPTPTPVDNGIGGRTITINWTAQSTNIFANILGLPSLAISGSATATASQPPNINFYVVVDNSVSMLTPATATGVSQLQATTSTNSGGCAFVCHLRVPQTGTNSYNYLVQKKISGKTYSVWIPDSPYTSPVTGATGLTFALLDSSGNVYDSSANKLTGYAVCPNPGNSVSVPGGNCSSNTISGQYADGYWAVENYSTLYPGNANITLRIDDASNAVQQLGPYAYQTSTTNNATYAIQEFFYNSTVTNPGSLYPALPSGVSYYSGTPVAQMTPMTTLTSSTSFNPPAVPVARWLSPACMTSTYCPNNGANTGPTSNNTGMFTEMNSLMPNPGTGRANSTPQEVLFLITDGYDDYDGVNRGPLTTSQLGQCSTIKARGIKIAVIYTQYLASSIQSQYPGYAAVLTPTDQVAAALQKCASTDASGSPLFYQVAQNQSIVTALQQLFASVVQSAYLAQ
jgi:Flp pilus assembly protein TadG